MGVDIRDSVESYSPSANAMVVNTYCDFGASMSSGSFTSEAKEPDSAVDGEETIEAEFERLAEEWFGDTQYESSVQEMAMHPAYQRIIGLGKPVLPFILRSLRMQPDHWFWALRAITGQDPVSTEDRGRVNKMAESWIRWGRSQGIV
jgi:hypothetical protein